LEGFVGGTFRTETMLAGVVPVFGPREMVLEIRDVEAPPGEDLISASDPDRASRTDASSDSGPRYSDSVELAGRRWRVLARPTERYLRARDNWTPALLLGSGVGVSLLLGGYLHTVLAQRDRVERQVDRRTEELREEIGRRRRYADALQRSNRELEHFAYIASHDLQEPLRKVRSFGDMLRAEAGDVLDDTARDYLRRMQDAAERMQALIQGLLAYSRVTTQAQPFERVQLQETVRQVVDDLAIRLKETGGEVRAEDLPEIEADPVQMRQLLQNLIINGLKFHRKGAPPEVRITCEVLADQSCRIRVRDNGVGFDPREAKRLFQPFQRLHSRAEFEGTGMGLAVCQKIAERHGGTIAADSTPGEGSVFTVTLPCHHSSGETANAA
jgi:signal transduction histidine kinase